MKKFRIIPVIAVIGLLASCSIEENNLSNGAELTKDEIAFALNKVSTRSAETVDDESYTSMSIELGDGFYLEESISSMDDLSMNLPETRGVPIYTENLVAKRTENITVSVLKGGETKQTKPNFGPDDYSLLDTENRIWKYRYPGKNPWDVAGSKDEKMFFFVYSDPENKAKNLTYTTTSENDMSVSFEYSSQVGKDAAAAQEDLLFTGKTESKSEYDLSHSKTGIPVTFYHALTAVKFRVGNDNSGETKTIITGVKFSNLKSTGACTIKPNDADNRVSWTTSETTSDFTQTFANPKYNKNSDNTVSFESGDGSNFGDSFYAAAADNNLNNADGSLTFFFIPQTIGDNVTLEVTFRVKTPDTPDGTEITHLIDFGKVIKNGGTNNVTWNAGELRTYTLKPTDVDVKIVDDMEGAIKSNLHITNTGNVDEYIRVMLLGNWCDEDNNIVVGYKYKNKDDEFEEGEDYNTMVKPWFRGGYDDDEDGTYVDPYGEFDKSFTLGEPQGDDNKWERGTGSYFYYTEKIGPGKVNALTDALFQQYELKEVPTIYIPSSTGGRVAAKVHLEFEVVVQAIGVPTKNDGGTETEMTCWEAWSAATGTTIKSKK